MAGSTGIPLLLVQLVSVLTAMTARWQKTPRRGARVPINMPSSVLTWQWGMRRWNAKQLRTLAFGKYFETDAKLKTHTFDRKLKCNKQSNK